jgi:FkbM family methyltransferase
MCADHMNNTDNMLAEMRDALRELANRIQLDPDEPQSSGDSIVGDTLLRIAGLASEVLSLRDYYASLTTRVAALEDGQTRESIAQSALPSAEADVSSAKKKSMSERSNSATSVLAWVRHFLRHLSWHPRRKPLDNEQLRGELLQQLLNLSNALQDAERARIKQIDALQRAHTEELSKLLAERDVFLRKIQVLERPGAFSSSPLKSSTAALRFPPLVLGEFDSLNILIVDVGAQNLKSEGHVYEPLVQAGVAKVIGFEPLPDEASKRKESEPSTVLMSYFIGTGGPAVFHVTKFNPASSLYEPNVAFLRRFCSLADMCETVQTIGVTTTRLDDVTEIEDCDFLKIDVQGGERDVIEGGMRLLDKVIALHTEVEFSPVYKAQPLFSDIDVLLRARSFDLIDLVCPGYNTYSAILRPLAQSRLLWADAIYFKRPEALLLVDPDKLIKAAYIAHVNYGMFDLAADYLSHYDTHKGTKLADIYNWALTGL